jgi:Zn-dependent peptidase ImmA (M78 family)
MYPLGTETRGLIKKYKRSHIICINNALSEIEQLKTCAHELGHYIMHRKINTLFMGKHTYLKTSLYETQANQFADLLLNKMLEN